MLQIAICDDEQKLRSGLQSVISTELDLKGLGYKIIEFDSGESLIEYLSKATIDIIFLDIEMKRLNGMETAKLIREKNQRTVIIFVTSYPDYVFEGYEVKALNYILKPYKNEKVIEVLYLALNELNAICEHYYTVSHKSNVIKLALSEVHYFYSNRRMINVVRKDEDISFYGKLNDLEIELPDFFVRIHNRYLVNINFITSINASSAICSNDKLPVSRNYNQELAVVFAKSMLR